MERQKTLGLFNPNMTVSLEVFDKKRCKGLVWLPFKKRWFGNRKEGFYDTAYGTRFTEEEIKIGRYYDVTTFQIHDNVVYYPPYVSITFANQRKLHYNFITLEEATEYGKTLAPQCNCVLKFNLE